MSARRITAKLTALAFTLADEYAAGIFESECYPQRGGNSTGPYDPWFRMPPVNERPPILKKCLRWLRFRDMLEHNPTDRTQVRIR